MAKFFRAVMSILLILFVAALAALFVPPLLDITTVVATPGVETNMQIGSVAYGQKTAFKSIAAGDTIISSTDEGTWLYEVASVDTETNELTVITSEDSEPVLMQARENVAKKVLVVPYIGYIVIAFQSTEGIIILGLGVALLVILFIISNILCQKSHKTDATDEDDTEYFRDLALGQSRPNNLDSLGTMTIPPVADLMEEGADAAAEDAALDEVEELPELILEPAEEPSEAEGDAESVPVEEEDSSEDAPVEEEDSSEDAPAEEDNAEEAPAEEDDSEPAPALAESPADTAPAIEEAPTEEIPVIKEDPTEEIPAVKEDKPASSFTETAAFSKIGDALATMLENEQMDQTPHGTNQPAPAQETFQPEPEPAQAEEIEIAIPDYTLDELLQEAYRNGEDPKVTKDAVTGITLVDYSNCL